MSRKLKVRNGYVSELIVRGQEAEERKKNGNKKVNLNFESTSDADEFASDGESWSK